MITIRIMWSRKEEKQEARRVAEEIVRLLKHNYNVKLKYYPNRRNEGGRLYIRLYRKTRADIDEKLDTIWDIVERIRDKYMYDVKQFMENGYSEHDCHEINAEMLRELKSKGFIARMDRLVDLKHYVVRVSVGGRYYIVDAVPELSGQFNTILDSGFVGTDEEALEFYNIGKKGGVRVGNRRL